MEIRFDVAKRIGWTTEVRRHQQIDGRQVLPTLPEGLTHITPEQIALGRMTIPARRTHTQPGEAEVVLHPAYTHVPQVQPPSPALQSLKIEITMQTYATRQRLPRPRYF